jgi:hypothetical protein
MAMVDLEDPCAIPQEELEPLWVQALDERFQECRPHIPLLNKLATDAGIDTIKALSDAVPLLFAHTAYKSYPEAFIERGQWDRMNLWLGTLSKAPVDNVDVNGVPDADEWLARLHAAGHYAFATSGTTGRISVLNQNAADVEFANRTMVARKLPKDKTHRIFIMAPRYSPNRMGPTFQHIADVCGRPGAVDFLTEEPMRITDMSQMARTRKRIAEGVAAPSEIADLESAIAARGAKGLGWMSDMMAKILEHRDEPLLIAGLAPQLLMLIQMAKEQGIPDGSFHPDTLLVTGGGNKGIAVPPDFKEQLMALLGITEDRFMRGYAMQEISTAAGMNEEGRYEFPAWIIPLHLDDTGEHLLTEKTAQVSGRMALFDTSITSRWGGIISGDRVTVDHDPSPSGRRVPAIVEITRYSDLDGGDDKLTCAGSVESFVRGTVE